MIDGLEDDNKHALIRACGFGGGSCAIYRINVFNGSLRDRQKLPNNSESVVIDSDNQAQYAVAQTERGFREVYSRADTGWTLRGRYPYPGGYMKPFSISSKDDKVYVLDGRDGGPEAVVKMDRDLASGEQVYRDRLTDITDSHSDKDGMVYAVEAGIGNPRLIELERDHPDLAQLKALRSVFPERTVKIVDEARGGDLLLVATYSDRVPASTICSQRVKIDYSSYWHSDPGLKKLILMRCSRSNLSAAMG
jgi:hypothetical protein